MIVKTYGMLWTLLIAGSVILLATGLFSNLTAVVLGFITITLTFMGMLAVLPSTFSKHSAVAKPVDNSKKKELRKVETPLVRTIAPIRKAA